MIEDIEKIKELFLEIDAKLTREINMYIIGGANLMFKDLKPATKDIDIVISEKREYELLGESLYKLGFSTIALEREYKNMELSQIHIKDDYRLDLFLVKVCSKFSLSKSMINKSQKIISLNNLNIFLVSNEDIFLFKTMTEREGDLEDCISLAKTTLDWDYMLIQIKEQIKLSGQDIWITWIGERLDILIERGLNIPIINEIDKLRLEYYK